MLELRDYQIKGRDFLKENKKVLLADSVGLGKSIQALTAAEIPVLLACPTYLMRQWKGYIKNQYPCASVSLCEGSRSLREKELSLNTDFTIINIEMLRTFEFKRKYKTFIVDEAHNLAGRNAQQSKNARKLAKEIPNVYLLTATPIRNTPDDLYMQLSILDYKNFSSYHRFVSDYCSVVETPWKIQVVGISNPEKLRRDLEKYMLRRTYSDAGRTLPPLIEEVITIKPTDFWRKKYNDIKNQYSIEDINFKNAMEVYTVLRQVTLCDEKLDVVKNLINDIHDDAGTIIFTWYRNSAYEVGEYLKVPYITGDVSANERIDIAKNNKVIVANIAALGTGVDLSNKNNIIFLEEDHSPSRMEQAIGRVQRDRLSTDPVRIFYIHIDKTLDQHVHNSRGNKEATILQVLKDEYVS
jgi:SNF2 family DNA or RNA helicase